MGIIAAVGAAAAIAKGISQVKTTLEDLDDERSVIILVANYTDYVFVLDTSHHEHGGFAVNPSGEIPAQSTDTYGSKDKGFLTGTEGGITYKARGANLYLDVHWNNPFIGGNSSSTWAYTIVDAPANLRPLFKKIPITSDTVRATDSTGAGNEQAEMRYEIRPIVPSPLNS
jgi:hypothetical protein